MEVENGDFGMPRPQRILILELFGRDFAGRQPPRIVCAIRVLDCVNVVE